jgi:hypothetical protein
MVQKGDQLDVLTNGAVKDVDQATATAVSRPQLFLIVVPRYPFPRPIDKTGLFWSSYICNESQLPFVLSVKLPF